MKTLFGTMLLAAFVIASAPFAAADCYEGAGSMACVSDYSNDDATMYMVEAYAVDGTVVYVFLFEGSTWIGGNAVSGDVWIDSPTLGGGVYAFAYGSDGIPTDGTYESGQVYAESYSYDGAYNYVWLGFKDTNGDGTPDDFGHDANVGVLP